MSLCRYFIYISLPIGCAILFRKSIDTNTKFTVARSIPILYLGDIFSCEYVLPSLLSHSVVMRESSCSNNLILFSVFLVSQVSLDSFVELISEREKVETKSLDKILPYIFLHKVH